MSSMDNSKLNGMIDGLCSAVGDRLNHQAMVGGQPPTVHYQYDDANRLIAVDDIPYTWDANGNLLSDGANTYTYDSANRLIMVASSSFTVQFAYNAKPD